MWTRLLWLLYPFLSHHMLTWWKDKYIFHHGAKSWLRALVSFIRCKAQPRSVQGNIERGNHKWLLRWIPLSGASFINACKLTIQFNKTTRWNLKPFSQNSGCYFKNHWTNTRLVCTHLNAFFMLNSNIGKKNLKFNIFWKKKIGRIWPVVCCTRLSHGEG